MKIKTISRSLDSSGREANTEVQKMRKNADPKLHPFEKAREVSPQRRGAKQRGRHGWYTASACS